MSSLLSGLFWAAYGIVFAWTTLLVLALIRRERIISTVEFFFKHLGDCTGLSLYAVDTSVYNANFRVTRISVLAAVPVAGAPAPAADLGPGGDADDESKAAAPPAPAIVAAPRFEIQLQWTPYAASRASPKGLCYHIMVKQLQPGAGAPAPAISNTTHHVVPPHSELTLSLDAARKINVSCSASWTRWRCCRRSVLSTGSLDELFDIPLAIYVMRNNELAAFLRDQGDPETSQLVLLRTLEELSRRLGPACKLDYVLPWDQLARMVKQPLTSLSRRALSVITSLLRKVSLQDIDPATLSPVLELLAAFPLSDVPADLAAASSAATGSSVGSSTGIAQKSLLPQYLEASELMISESSQTRQLFCRQQSYAPALLASFDDMDALRMLVKLYELERGALPPATRKLFLGAFCFSSLCHAAEVWPILQAFPITAAHISDPFHS